MKRPGLINFCASRHGAICDRRAGDVMQPGQLDVLRGSLKLAESIGLQLLLTLAPYLQILSIRSASGSMMIRCEI